MDAGLQNKFLLSLWPGQKSASILLSTNSFDSSRLLLRPETHHRPRQSSQYDVFLSQARDQCFTRLAKMRRNTVTYRTTADFANRETCSFIRLNDAFRKTSGLGRDGTLHGTYESHSCLFPLGRPVSRKACKTRNLEN